MLKHFFAFAVLLSSVSAAQALDLDASDRIIMDIYGPNRYICTYSSRVFAIEKPFKSVSGSCDSACSQAMHQCETLGVGDCIKLKCVEEISTEENIPSRI